MGGLRGFALKLLRLVAVVIVVTFLTFWLTKLSPGDPVSKVKPFAPPAERAQITQELGLNNGFFDQYATWLGDFTTGNFGKLYDSGTPVRDVVDQRLPVSLELMIYAQLLSLLIAIPLGVYTAYKQGSRFDGISNTLMFALLALPTFVLAPAPADLRRREMGLVTDPEHGDRNLPAQPDRQLAAHAHAGRSRSRPGRSPSTCDCCART